jgi:hypothetical protein
MSMFDSNGDQIDLGGGNGFRKKTPDVSPALFNTTPANPMRFGENPPARIGGTR